MVSQSGKLLFVVKLDAKISSVVSPGGSATLCSGTRRQDTHRGVSKWQATLCCATRRQDTLRSFSKWQATLCSVTRWQDAPRLVTRRQDDLCSVTMAKEGMAGTLSLRTGEPMGIICARSLGRRK